MNVSQIIYQKLKDLVDGHVYPLFVAENANVRTPYIIYSIISSLPDNTLDGITGHEWVHVQIDVYHHDYDELLALSSKVIFQLNDCHASYDGANYRYDDGLYRAIIECGMWQTMA